MCGIAGFAGVGDRSVLEAMTRALAHRGPDDEGYYIDPGTAVHFGHRRLAIIDVASGHQPMWNEDGNVGVVFNGEIYNHMTLRAELEARGHRFATDHSDTEVLVHGYEEWGEALIPRLNGMFAFAIYDRKSRRLMLARDRFGEKPLFYAIKSGFIAFASELNALTLHPHVGNSIDPRSVQKLFAYGYLPAPNALSVGCRKLPGGNTLTFDLASGAVSIKPYWQFHIEPDDSLTDDREGELVEELRSLMADAVARRLISDVPLGVFLSGGIDSSACLAFASRKRAAASIETFTIGFDDPSFDESGYARDVAAAFGSHHREQQLSLQSAAMSVNDILARMDEPLGDPSLLPTFMLSKFARQHVTVALTGDGGDELFAGYDPFKALGPAQAYDRWMPSFLHSGVRRLVDCLPISGRNMSLDFKLRRALAGVSYPPAAWVPVWMSALEPRDLKDIFEQPLRVEEVYEEAITVWERNRTGNIVDRTLEFFTSLYLQDDILAKTDRAGMMVSLEARSIFLDNDLVDFCQRLPHRFKYRNGQGKYLLKKALEGVVPDSVLKRPKKGFGIPLIQWLGKIAPSPPLAKVPGVDLPAVAELWRQHTSGAADRRLLMWTWLSLQRVIGADAARPQVLQEA
jgi:asparagine synthase (glutamine-hydrolysing)